MLRLAINGGDAVAFLTPDEAELIGQWIEEGARRDGWEVERS